MMDPLSFTASLIAVAGLAGTVFNTSQTLYDIAEQFRSAREDIERFALDMRNFGIVIKIGHRCLNDFFSTCEPASPLFRFFKDLKVLESLAEESELTRKGIRRARSKTLAAQSSNHAFARLKWVFRKKHLNALHPGMERVKSNFALMMAYVNFEMAQRRGESEENRREIKSLKRQIRLQLDTIDLLQRSERRRMEESGETSGIYHSRSVAGHEIQDKLSFLGAQIIDHGTVPDPKEYTPFSSRVFSNDRFSGAYGHRTSMPHSQSSGSSNPRSRRTERSTSTATSPISSVATTVESRDVRSLSKGPPELRQERRRLPPRQGPGPASSSSSPISVRSDDVPHPLNLVQHVEERPKTTFEEDFISVGPKNHILKLNANRSVKSVQGYVNTNNGAVSTTALLDEALDYNLISLSDVHRFGLDMEPPDDEEPVCFQTEQGEKKSCGQVVLVWDEGVPSRKPFRVRCLVYGHDIRPLLFGKPFLDRRTHYWSGRGSVESGVEERVIVDGRGRDKDEM